MNYCGIKRPLRTAVPSSPNCFSIFNKDDEPFETLGSRIQRAIDQGADLGAPVVVTYDEENVTDVDALSDANLDLEDLQEIFGNRAEVDPAIQPTVPDDNKTE